MCRNCSNTVLSLCPVRAPSLSPPLFTLQLLPQLPYRLLKALQVRIDRQRLLIALDRIPPLRQVRVAMPLPRPSPEVTCHPIDRTLAIEFGVLVLFEEVIRDRPLVVGLGEIRVELNRPPEVLERALELPVAQALRPPRQLRVGRLRPAPEPDRPERMLGHLVRHHVRVPQPLGQRI